MPKRAAPQSRGQGRGEGRIRGGGERPARAPGNRARGRMLAGGRSGDAVGGGLGNRAMGRLFDREGGGGERLDRGLRAQMEKAFDADFSGVRLIRGSSAARGLGAEAVTRGERVHLAPGRYAPGTFSGKALIGHELAHVVQQRKGVVRATAQAKGVHINQDRGLEAEADRAGERAARGMKARVAGGARVGGGPPVAQCKVGMEFQATSGGGTGVKKKNGLRWEAPRHAEIISKQAGFTVETDGTDIEYVLSAVDERSDEGVRALVGAATAAAAIHKKITDTKDLAEGDLDVAEFDAWSKWYEVKAKKSDTLYRLYKGGHPNAHPQATVGIKLTKITDFMDLVGQTSTSVDPDWQRVGYGRKAKRRTDEQAMLRETVARVRAQITALETGWQSQGLTLSEASGGFLAMLVQYVRGTTTLGTPKTANAKNAYSLMGRTSLRAMYLMLPDFDRTVIDAILGDGHVAYQGVRNYLFGSTDPDEIIIASEALGMGTSQVKLSDLEKSFAAKEVDPMSRFSGISELGVGAGKLATYGMSRPTDIGHDTEDTRVEGAVMEMRALGRNVEPDRWAEVTASVLAIIRGINA